MIITDQLINFNDKMIKKNNKYSLTDNNYRQFPPKIGIFSTHSKSKKKVPYGSFFLRTKTFGHNTFCITSHVIKMDNFIFLIIKLLIKIIYTVLWINIMVNIIEI